MPTYGAGVANAVGTRELFVGRREEFTRLGEALAQARDGVPRLVLVEGPGGIGKTALVQRFLTEAGAGCVVSASGDEDEVSLEFGVLTQLFTSAAHRSGPGAPGGPGEPTEAAHVAGGFGAGGPQSPQSPQSQRRRDHGVAAPPEGHVPVSRWGDPLVAGAAVVDLLGQMQRADAVVLVVDDAQWADRPSLQALTFALRRLRVDRVLAVLVARDVADPRIPDGLRRLLAGENVLRVRLRGLGVEELRSLGGRLGVGSLSARGAQRLHAHTDGSPLHARALLEQVPAAAFDDSADSTVPLPAPRSFAALVAARLAGCAPEVEQLVAAASVLGMHAPVRLAAVVAGSDDPLPALEQAIAAGLLEERLAERGVSFPHPLVQAAVYRQLGPARRAELHLRAAAHAEGEAVRLRHRARAASGPDAVLAGELARLGRRDAASGAWVSAADHLSSAARLTSDRAEHEQFILEMVECQLLAGDVSEPAGLAARLRGFTATGWRSYILARLALIGGALDECEALLRDAWQRADPAADPAADPVLGARIAGHFALLYGNDMRGEEQTEWADRALRLAPGQTATDLIRYLRLNGATMSGQAEAALAALAGLPEPALASAAELEELLGRGALRIRFDDLDGALRDLGGVLAASHDRSAMFRWVTAGFLVMAEFRAGRWDDAVANSELALSIAADADQAHLALFCNEVAILVPAARGDWPAAEAHVQVLRAAAESGYTSPVVNAALAQAQLARAKGLPEEVVAALDPLLCPRFRHVVEMPGVAWWIAPLFDALVAVGELDRAEAALGRYEALAAQRGHRSALAASGHARGVLAAARGDEAVAERSFDEALAHAGRVGMPFDRALLQLAYGKFLRRAGRRARAGEQLRAAREVFARLGARPDLDRCEQELAACGLVAGPRRQRDASELTPQEHAVARLVATGLTNRAVARELVISAKTVEYHLGHVYAKLAVSSRAQLAGRLAGA